MDVTLTQLWEQGFKSDALPTFKETMEFLDRQARIGEVKSGLQVKKGVTPPSKPQVQARSHVTAVEDRTCSFCPSKHYSYQCQVLAGLDVSQRIAKVKELHLCFNCLRPGHRNLACKSISCKKCGSKHHTLLHFDKSNSIVPKVPGTLPQTLSLVPATLHQNSPAALPAATSLIPFTGTIATGSTILLATAKVYVQDIHGNYHTVKALMDSGSQTNFISNALYKKLQIPKLETQATIIGIGASVVNLAKGSITLSISSRVFQYQECLDFIILNQITTYTPAISSSQHYLGLNDSELADPTWYLPEGIDMLLGADILARILLPNLIPGSPGYPTAQASLLGWLLFGRCSQFSDSNGVSLHVMEANTDVLMQRFWEIETFPTDSKTLTTEENLCEEHFQNTHYRQPCGRFVVRLPFRNDAPLLGESRNMALKQFFSLERRFQGNPELKTEYKKFIDEYINLNHMERIHPSAEPSHFNYYLPHHAVWKESDGVKKIRVVFNASGKTSNQKSLNDELLTGPAIQNEIFEILIKFRRHPIALISDIEKMYRQVLIHPEDKRYQRILWRNSPSEPMQEYQLNTVTYGMTSAPYSAIRALHQLASTNRTLFPQASNKLLDDFYVDDFVSGADTIAEATTLCSDMIKLLESGGFHLRKWASNCSEAIAQIPVCDRWADDNVELLSSSTSTLGLCWNPHSDNLSIKYHARELLTITKRAILSEAARIYDPIGLVSPVSIQVKTLMQELWAAGFTWDIPLPANIQTKWNKLKLNLALIPSLQIPRFLHMESTTEVMLCGFCDASEVAYAAVVYVRSCRDNQCTSTLLCSKTRVAPLKRLSIPRLELCGALLLASLLKTCQTIFNLPSSSLAAWTDSTVALQWIQAVPSHWKPFVANRVAAIQDLIPPNQWQHVRSQENPADIPSRGQSIELLRDNSLWWKGPVWLESEILPTEVKYECDVDQLNSEAKKSLVVLATVTSNFPIDIARYSSLTLLIRVTAWCLRLGHIGKKQKPIHSFLTTSELDQSLQLVIRHCQAEVFSDIITLFEKNKPLKSGHQLLSLSPFLDSEGILRVGGRLEFADIPFSRKHPILLPAKGHFTKLVILHEHLQQCHAGPNSTLAAIRRRFWIVKGRNTIRTVTHNCTVCMRQRAKPPHQLMGNLPENRTSVQPPFHTCGVDMTGPLQMRVNSKGRKPVTGEGYIMLAICFSTKAIHLELVSEVSAPHVIMAVQRFSSRRGFPRHMYSDNANVFQTAKGHFREMTLPIDTESLRRDASLQGIDWHFIPPGAPHFGGLWEANIKMTKRLLNRILGKGVLTYEELNTLLTRVEACLNSRPLTPISTSPDDFEALTPGHFLIGKALTTLPQEHLETQKTSLQKRWRLQHHLLCQFWDRWQTEYVANLQQRYKWQVKSDNVQIGDLVLIKTKHNPLSKWPLGRIVKVFPGRDNLVRSVMIKTKDGERRRPITQISVLPFQQNVEEL